MTLPQPQSRAGATQALGRKREHALMGKQEDLLLLEKRKVAWLALVGFAIGAAAAHFYAGQRFTVGGLWGSIAGAAIGWLWAAWRIRRNAA